MRLSICIPVFNNYNLTKACLRDLSFLPDDVEVIICDNNSTDDTINLLDLPKKQLPKNFKYIKNDTNIGFGLASNKAFNVAVGEYILFLNNDIRVQNNHKTWPDILIKCASGGGLVSPNVGMLDYNLNFISEGKIFNTQNTYLSGWCLCGKKETFNKLILQNDIGPFDSSFFVFFEDTDLSFRAKQLNIELICADIPVIHFGHQTAKKCNLSKLYLESQVIFKNKWLGYKWNQI